MNLNRLSWICCLSCVLFGTSAHTAQSGRILKVGPGKAYKVPSQAAAAAKDGDVVEIDAGIYNGDVAVWTANRLVIKGVGGRAHLKVAGQNAQGKGIWVLAGNDTVVDNIEFSGARVPDENGAGIRVEGSGLTIRNCYFHDNENGILTGNNGTSDIRIEGSEFANNGHGDGKSHNIYVGGVRSFTLQYSYVHHAKIGHNVKSRAQTNYILYNRIMDERTGTASYEIDLPNGGRSYIIGNLIHKGDKADNPDVIAYSAEGATNQWQELYVVNNTLASDVADGSFIHIHGRPSAQIVNNIFAGNAQVVNGTATMSHNLTANKSVLVDPAGFNYHLRPGSPAIDAGVNPGTAQGFDLTPKYQYVHPLGQEPRMVIEALDIGAYEFAGGGVHE